MADRHDPLKSLINSLPEEITLNIFSRLPVESVLNCKQVCKSWRNFLQFHVNTNTYFAYQHLQRQHGCGLTHTQEQNRDGSDAAIQTFVAFNRDVQALYHEEYHEDRKVGDNQPIYRRRRINIKFPACKHIVGSCNGLICLISRTNYNGVSIFPHIPSHSPESPDEPSYICNPVTREFVHLPRIYIDKKKIDLGVHIICGFGYHPLTNAYKVVRISYFGLPRSRGVVEIYKLGSDSGWTSAGETNLFFESVYHSPSVCWNGSLYWLHKESGGIVAFDLADEKFHSVPNPPGLLNTNRRLCVLRSCLCLITVPADPEIGYRDYYNVWFSKDNVSSYRSIEQSYKSRNWRKMFRMKSFLDIWNTLYFLFALTKEDELLFPIKGITRHDLKTQKDEKIWVLEERDRIQQVPLPHICSFISLKALGERNVEMFLGAPGNNELNLHASVNTR
ncbi:F-box protein At3g07870-like [Papaver somniferum]|uniref:F-box protein At3g07870-like n=1 Tax=Papaver somniferum TaxID=3469 RepID=UPI000E700E11|nr:F-box protein At3g07870-like [Papaver somniferum]